MLSRGSTLTLERGRTLIPRAYIVPLTFGRARIVVDHVVGQTYESEFW